jgi:signal transduction histidine kinase/ligand-binding sensor domain-containing protein/CheY-like chemotaxis protein/AraC-like DNA-binding protein
MRRLLFIVLTFTLQFINNTSLRAHASVSYILSIRDGLVDNSIYTIAKDKRGFMWFGSWKGLCSYDTREFKTYKNDPNNPRSLSSDFIKSSYNDSQGNLWIGTNWGLNRYDPVTDSFERFYRSTSNQNSLSDNTILCFMEDRRGNLWIGTGNGLSRLSTIDGKVSFKRFLHSDQSSGKKKYITSIYEDPQGVIWMVASNELLRMDISDETPDYQLVPFTNALQKREYGSVLSLYGDQKGNMWVGSAANGLARFDRKTKQFHSFRNAPALPGEKQSFLRVEQIVASQKGDLWLRTDRGTLCFNPASDNFEVQLPNFIKKNNVPENETFLTLYIDPQDNVWVGTYADGVKHIPGYSDFFIPLIPGEGEVGFQQVLQDFNGNLWFQAYGNDPSGKRQSTWYQFRKPQNTLIRGPVLGGDCSRSYFDSRGTLWLGLFGNILVNYKVESGKLVELERYQLPHVHTNIPDWVTAFTEDKKGLFVGTANNGLYFFDREKNTFLPYGPLPRTKTGAVQKHITFLLNDSKENLWIGTSYGVTLVHAASGKKQYFPTATEVQESASTRTVNSVHEDNKGRIWMILSNEGLYLFDPAKGHFISKNQSKEIRGHNITNMLHDNKGNLLLSNELGLVEYNTETGTARQFFFHEGIPGSRMMSNSALKTSDGLLFSTTNSGGFYVNPQQIPFNRQPPPLAFTQLRLFNKPVTVGDPSGLLKQNISETDQITFEHNQSIFSVDFAVLNFTSPEKNQYAYRLDGFEKGWNYVKNPTATYTNLPSGDYTLLITGANNDGIWNSAGSRLRIKVLPPWWNTWYAWTFYILAMAGIIYYLNRFFWLKKVFEKEKQLQDVKLNFFTNISHEIRTRLMLISGPVEQLLRSKNADSDAEEVKLLEFVSNSSDNLLNLVNELMDFRKMESGITEFVIREHDVVALVKNVTEAFEHLAVSRDIRTSFLSDKTYMMLWFDADQFQKVIYNLLSNAYKFTGEGGQVNIEVKEQAETVVIKISDNGIGIAPEYLSKLFENYFQVAESKGQSTGYGVGLALAKSIVENMKGTLEVSSRLADRDHDGLTVFKVTLLKGKQHFKPEQISSQARASETGSALLTIHGDLENDLIGGEKKFTILFVEDNDHLRAFISDALGWRYEVMQATNGEEAWTIAMQSLPDLVISDVMMAGMDGLQLCTKIKFDLRTSHIPVILLTAKTTVISQLEGLESGADLYITKPLSMRVLELSIKNLLNSRKAMQVKYSRQISLSNAVIDTGISKEDDFLNVITKFVEDNINNQDIGVAELCRHVGMSKSVLYRKLRALTDMTINDFIKIIRFKEAARLLKEDRLSVQEVATLVGYDDRKYFSKEFKKHFGKTPSEFAS